MRSRHLLALVGLACLFVPPPTASAQGSIPGLSISFVQPFGTGTPTDAFPIWTRLSLDPGAAALHFDGTAAPDFGLPAGSLPTDGSGPGGLWGPFDTYTDAHFGLGFGCSGTFTVGCTDGSYAFDWNSAPPTISGRTTLDLLPGESFDYILGTFTPVGAGAPPGTYRFYRSVAILWVNGTSAAGDPLQAGIWLQTCPMEEDACAFTRTVSGAVVTPEPASAALLASGLAGLGWLARRRRAA